MAVEKFVLTIVKARGGKEIAKINVTKNADVKQLQNAFHSKFPSLYPTRQRFTVEKEGKKVVLTKGALTSYGIGDGSVVMFKDLGTQIDYQTVFIMEYLGPFLVYLMFYMRPAFIYGAAGADAPLSFVQNIAGMCWLAHYAKRLFETIFIHRFSHATMPIFNLFKNCSYYWGFAGYVAYYVNHPLHTAPTDLNLIYAGLGIFIFSELSNLICHIKLRNLRPAGTTERRIPRGFLFEFVSCPNYTVEISAWFGFNLMTNTVAGYLFMCAGAYQMLLWAQGKHRRYRKEFKDYPRGRKIIVPFLY